MKLFREIFKSWLVLFRAFPAIVKAAQIQATIERSSFENAVKQECERKLRLINPDAFKKDDD